MEKIGVRRLETLKEFPIVTNSDIEKGFWQSNQFSRFGNPFQFPTLLVSETYFLHSKTVDRFSSQSRQPILNFECSEIFWVGF